MPELFEIIGKGAMRLATENVQTITDSDWHPLEFDTVTDERGGISCDPATNSITVSSTGLYTVNHGLNGVFDAANEIDVVPFVNGVAYSTHYLALQGRNGARPVSLFWQSTVTLNAGDIIDIRAQSFDTASFDITFYRLYLCLIKEH